MSFVERLDRGISRCEWVWGGFARICELTILAIVVVDVVLRYVFNQPLEWSYDIISRYLTVALFFFSLSWTLGAGEHVRVVFFRRFVPWQVRRLIDLVGAAVALLVFAVIFVLGSLRFWSEWTEGSVSVGIYLWPNWIASICVPLGLSIMILRLIQIILANGAALYSGKDIVFDQSIEGDF
jgi:TRAP-type C4-dicarboxylate transport system permease small subunit